MLTTTTETIPGHEVAEIVGVARGNTVEARNVGRDITQSIRNLTGGAIVLGPNSNGDLVVGGPRGEIRRESTLLNPRSYHSLTDETNRSRCQRIPLDPDGPARVRRGISAAGRTAPFVPCTTDSA